MRDLLRIAMVLVATGLLFTSCTSETANPTATPSPGPTATITPTPIPTCGPSPSPTVPVTPTFTPSATATKPAPTATATKPAPTATPTRTPSATIPADGTLYEHGDRGSNLVALTFDMGGRVDPALDIMAWLSVHRVPATIFMTGAMAENVNTDAGRQVLQIVGSHPELFDLGNHSYSHPDFRDLTAGEVADELSRTEAAIAKYTTRSPRPFFRPPFGGQNATVVARTAANGYPATIMWDVDTIDWMPESDGGPTADDIVAKVAAKAQGGSIVLMHLGGYNTFEALPRIVEALRAKGLEPAMLSDVVGR